MLSPPSTGTAVSACAPEAWSFARVEELWARFAPLTPYGKDRKEERLVLGARAAIERAYDDTEACAAYAAGRAGGADLDRLSYHLRRLPRLPFAGADADLRLDLVDLFQVKKFVANYRAVSALLDEPLRARFGLRFELPELGAALDEGGADPETFYIADAMHPGLGAVRAAAADKSAALRAERDAARRRALADLGLDFGPRDFLVVPNELGHRLVATRPAGVAVTVEAYDAHSCVVRLQDDAAALTLVEALDGLLARERELEAEVVARLSRLVAAASATLLAYAAAVCALDLARARAVLAGDLGLVRPDLGSGALAVRGGRFLPCAWDCERLGLAYTPLDVTLAEPAAVLFGSNMGGKTVALQTLAFLQAVAQTGLFVPAEAFATSVYPWIGYVGEVAGGRSTAARGGLSGFGFEIRSFVDCWEEAVERGAFVVFDEFARTTSSGEAEAILSAIVEALAARPGTRSVLATHYRGVARLPGVRYLRMGGLDRARAAEAMGTDEALAERIRRINGLMRYEVADDAPGEVGASDATVIAALLGLDPGIVARAEDYYAGRHRDGDDRA
jgi:DNA mismatch repair protein MutS2